MLKVIIIKVTYIVINMGRNGRQPIEYDIAQIPRPSGMHEASQRLIARAAPHKNVYF